MHDLCRNLLILYRQPLASQPGHLPVNLDGSQSTWPQLPVNLVICLSTWTAASQPDQQPVNLASSQSTWPVASSAIGLQNMGDPLWCPLRCWQWKSGDIHYWSVDHQWYNICTLTSVITKKFSDYKFCFFNVAVKSGAVNCSKDTHTMLNFFKTKQKIFSLKIIFFASNADIL